ncbi:Uncharacterised protein [Klebsiella pneumoniae]|uniref:Uncharacterized protein n=1 Tax=Klebsiella pneumoniae TaxID=573 RepID=A0A378A162_KLEPN|nr:Uncharacterised protein [Klebsiella pneumoniae]
MFVSPIRRRFGSVERVVLPGAERPRKWRHRLSRRRWLSSAWSDALQRQQVVHDREHPFLHLAAVPGAADQLNALVRLKATKFPIEALLFHCGLVHFARSHDEVGLEFSQLFIARTDEHVFNEVRLPGHFGNETYAETGIGVGAAESVDDKQAFTGQLLGHQPFQMLPGFLRKRLVVVFTFAFIGHQTVSRVVSSRTRYLSFGERPVKCPCRRR